MGMKKAQTLLELRDIQAELAHSGAYGEAIKLGTELEQRRLPVVLSYLGVRELPEGLNATLVAELALHAAALDADPVATSSLRSVLRRTAWSKDETATDKLMEAKNQLPDLKEVEKVLRSARTKE